MILNYDTIAQDQLVRATASGKVCVHYPRGADSWLEVDTNGHAYIEPASTPEGAYRWAVVLSSGNLLYLADRVDSVPTIVLGAALISL